MFDQNVFSTGLLKLLLPLAVFTLILKNLIRKGFDCCGYDGKDSQCKV